MSDDDKAKELIGLGSDIAGSVAGAAVGALGGPVGIAVTCSPKSDPVGMLESRCL
jgi:hypothetical protein